jgi:hypothetical protein
MNFLENGKYFNCLDGLMIKKPNLDYIIYGVIGIVLGAILTLAGTNMVYG